MLQMLIDVVWTAHKLRAVGGTTGSVNAAGGGTWGVLHTLVREGPMTVPQIARLRPVARQHIQVLANELEEAGLVTFKENPAHKRSKLVALTNKGRAHHDKIEDKMLGLTQELLGDLAPRNIETASDVISQVMQALDQRIESVGENEEDKGAS